MTRRKYISLLAGLLLILAALGAGSAAYAQDPTIPTRTPTPGSGGQQPQPSPTSGSDNGGGSNPPPAATETSAPPPPGAATATATLPGGVAPVASATATAATIILTPAGTVPSGTGIDGAPGAVAADPCLAAPIVRAIDLTLVHAGPGADYPVVGSLNAGEERLIIGRAEYAEWWQIRFIAQDPILIGWVADEAVDEFGDTGSVPLDDPPLLNGVLPTPGASWQPTPLPPVCTVTPTPTPTETSTPTATATPRGAVSGEGGDAAVAAQAEAGTGAPGLSSQGSVEGKQAGGAQSQAATSEEAAQEAATTGAASAGSSAASSLVVPALGIALIAGGVIVALLSRGKPPAA